MTTVETLRGPVAADALKTVLMHEHTFVVDEDIRRNDPELWDESHVIAEPVGKLTRLAELGVSTIVDPAVVGLGRDVARVARVNARVDINMFVIDSAPFVVHTSAPHRSAVVARDVFRGEGVDPGALVLDHSGDADDLDYVRTLIDQGSYVGMDRFGLDLYLYLPGEQRIANLVRLLDEGLDDRLMLSHDASCHIDWLPPKAREQIAPNWHSVYIHQQVLPALRRAGAGEEQVTTMLVDSPRRFLTRGRLS
ncbi:phosphotriesterase family protein [Streptomyces mirabilis]